MRRPRLISQTLLIAAILFPASLAAIAVSPTTWAKVREWSVPEARQAAAADERFLYAITNTLVAKYDRGTGQRVAVSTGKAEHLNSGFVWDHRVYCAHSNYPKLPEQSQIMVLDPETMQLSTFKDFGNAGGSLTWAVRHEGSWWCNFARYGADNAGTFLVKYDDSWRELGRWTYPPEIFRELHDYSFSGGLWRDGSLLLTGHDDPVLFRFQILNGKLQLVEKQSVPFTGQGIAEDPGTGGLVGIDRARRKFVLAQLVKPSE
ncbi:endonuclease [Singulisphaera sp. Ch08]|uniref:Endonuclease n=1 Tax=Singulisphaera sp. Ch08 TaxID=3120278 RepID=A0AAU7CFU9_9BACT